jgi:polysaccharide export outer membrane protein
LSSVYSVDAAGRVSIPLAGTLKAEDKTTQQIASSVRKALREANLVDDPKVSVEVAFYRPFSIIGEVRGPGRFPYAPGMTLEDAVAAAGGYTIHADREVIRVTTRVNGAQITNYRPPTASFLPGDTLYVRERWYYFRCNGYSLLSRCLRFVKHLSDEWSSVAAISVLAGIAVRRLT